MMNRRQFLAQLGAVAGASSGAAVLAVASPALAKKKRSKVRDIYRGKRGTTLWLDLDAAPYPMKGAPYNDPTVIVFVPHYFRVRGDMKVDAILHLHGFRDTADAAMKRHQLREQLADSKQNAIIIFPQGPVNAEDSSYGKLDAPRGMLNLLSEVRKTLQSPRISAALGPAGIPRQARIGQLLLSAHSGAFKAASRCIEYGGFNINECFLFDALYGRASVFADWVASTYHNRGPDSTRHKLISYYSGERVTAENVRLMRLLKHKGVAYATERAEGSLSRADLTRGRAIFIQTAVSHQGVLFRTNALRDCLFASCLKRYKKSSWFEGSDKPRDIDKRPR